jgi:hypothetical protein
MKLSDRDKKLILGILLIAIIVLPIFLFIRPKIDAIKGLDTELVTLNERYNYLKDLDSKRPFYESEIARLNEERKDLVKGFAKGILQENTIMFLRDAELSFPINMSAESFGEYNTTVVDDELTALTTTTGVSYSCEYAQIKDFLNYIFTYSDKMTIPAITMKYDAGNISGSFDISEFAFINDEEQVKQHPLPAIDRGGNEAIFANALPVVEGEEEEETVEETPAETETETEAETTED